MPQIAISNVNDTGAETFPALAGVSSSGDVESRAVVKGADRPLRLWIHDLQAGASIAWRNAAIDHMIYVWKGDATAQGKILDAHSVAAVEHGGDFELTAGPAGATLVHFHEDPEHPAHVGRPGGHVHCVGPEGIHMGQIRDPHTVFTLWADSACPNCEMWLSSVDYSKSRPTGAVHFHDQHEIIFVLKGAMKVGRNEMGAGTAVAIDKDTVYTFGIAEEGLTFLNFRPSVPAVINLNPDRSHKPARDERAFFHGLAPIV